MKKTIFLLGTLLTTSLAYSQTTASTTPQEPQALASAFFKALEKEDAAAIAGITTDDFAIVSFDGQTADRDLLGQALSGGYLIVETASAINLRSRTYNGNTAIVSGDSKFKGSVQGTNFDNNVIFLVTCVKMGTGWKIASAQLSGSLPK
jgi:ketosteroid isomerase-like protein